MAQHCELILWPAQPPVDEDENDRGRFACGCGGTANAAALAPQCCQGHAGPRLQSTCRRAGVDWLLWTLLALLSLAPTLADRSPEHAEQLINCLSEGQGLRMTTWNTSVLEDALPNLVLSKVWYSRHPPRFNLTIITQLSVDRSVALFNQCTTYLGPMSAAVYLPLVQTPDEGNHQLSKPNAVKIQQEVEKLQMLHDRAEAAGGCQLDLMLFYEVYEEASAAMLYPVNALRNYARMQVRTKLLSAVDVDMMISTSLSAHMMQADDAIKTLETLALSRVATVLPAFEPSRQGVYGRMVADSVAVGDKAQVEALWRTRQVRQFKIKVFPRGHTPTNYTQWFTSQDLYHVKYVRMFEPWFITHWDVMPWFDVNFKGYGLNKIVHVASLNYYGFTFQVHPGAWLIHRPHEDTAVRKVVARQASDVNKLGIQLPRGSLYTKVTQLFGIAKLDMIQGRYAPQLDPRMVKCMEQLTWLQPMKELKARPVDPALFMR